MTLEEGGEEKKNGGVPSGASITSDRKNLGRD